MRLQIRPRKYIYSQRFSRCSGAAKNQPIGHLAPRNPRGRQSVNSRHSLTVRKAIFNDGERGMGGYPGSHMKRNEGFPTMRTPKVNRMLFLHPGSRSFHSFPSGRNSVVAQEQILQLVSASLRTAHLTPGGTGQPHECVCKSHFARVIGNLVLVACGR